MLLSYSVSNFLSIKDKVTLSFEVKNDKEKPQNLIETVGENKEKIKLLKGLFLFGANASGKSNILKSINCFQFLLRLGTETIKECPNFAIKDFRYAFDEKNKHIPVEFEIKFLLNGKKIKYILAYVNNEFVKESLSVYNLKNRAMMLYGVNKGKLSFGSTISANEKKSLRKIFTWAKNKTFLAAIAREKQDHLKAYNDIWDMLAFGSLVIQYPNDNVDEKFTLDYINFVKHGKDEVLQLLQNADNRIKDIVLKKKNNGEQEIFFKYSVNGKDSDISFYDESAGTRRLFKLAAIFLVSIIKGKTDGMLVIDEIDDCFHPVMVKSIIKFLLSHLKRTQLVASTHYTGIMNLLRRDQVVMVDKNNEKLATTVSTMADFTGVRKDLKKEKAYLEGFFGAVPYLTLSDDFEEDEE